MTRGDPVALPQENDSLAKLGYLTVSCLPFILHLAFMAATAFFIVHVQVRLIHLLTLIIFFDLLKIIPFLNQHH